MLFSVIIPVYQVEQYLNECVDSVLNQDFNDFEIILVNDASPDGCGKICDEYANKDKRIKAIHHSENLGLSVARNTGINAAIGKFLLFLDSDDFFCYGNLYAIFYTLQKNPDVDIVFLSMSKCTLGKEFSSIKIWKKPLEIDFKGMNNNEILSRYFKSDLYNPSASSKLVRKNLIIENNIYFRKGIISEDLPWTYELLLRSNSYLVCEADHCVYRARLGSISRSKDKCRNIPDLVNFILEWAKYCEDKSNKNSDIYLWQLAFQYIIAMGSLFYLPKKIRIEVANKVKPLSWVLKCSEEKRVVFARKIFDLFGFSICALILNMYLRTRDLGLYLRTKLFV